MTRVIQWATGITGMMSLRHVIGRPDLELVGVRVYDPAKSGVDAGTLCGMDEVGVIATDDRQALIDADADVVLYMGKVETDTEGCFADVCDLLASGKNVVATGSRFIHPRSLHEDLADGIETACRAGSSSFLGLGLYPGFFGESLGPVLSRLTQKTQPHQRARGPELLDIRQPRPGLQRHGLRPRARRHHAAADQHGICGERLDRQRHRARAGARTGDSIGGGLPRGRDDAAGIDGRRGRDPGGHRRCHAVRRRGRLR